MIRIFTLIFCCLFLLNISAQTDSVNNAKDTTLLISFEVIPKEGHVFLSWITATENNNAYFTIERSKDRRKFHKVIDVPAAGTSTSYKEYVETDYQPYTETSYYRIKQTDFNGVSTYFPTTGVLYNSKKKSKVSVNQPTVSMDGGANQNKEVLVVLQDADGKNLTGKVILIQEESQLSAVDEHKVIPPGIYIIVASSEGNMYGQKVIVKE
jgi:hypothetical protein